MSRFVFRHLPRDRMKPDELAKMIRHANDTGQINLHRTRIFKDIMNTKVVTVCMAVDENGQPIAQGYSFCRGDMFNREDGRWRAENRLRAQLGLELLPDPTEERRRQREAAKAQARERGLQRQAEVRAQRGQGQ